MKVAKLQLQWTWNTHTENMAHIGSCSVIMPPPLIGGGIKRWCCLTSIWRLMSVAYIGPKSRTERPRKTKIGTEVALVTRDSDTTFKVKTQGHQATLVAWSIHYLTCMDDNIIYATAQSEPLPVDLVAGHSVAGGLPPTACLSSVIRQKRKTVVANCAPAGNTGSNASSGWRCCWCSDGVTGDNDEGSGNDYRFLGNVKQLVLSPSLADSLH